jgi:hypothetical protein
VKKKDRKTRPPSVFEKIISRKPSSNNPAASKQTNKHSDESTTSVGRAVKQRKACSGKDWHRESRITAIATHSNLGN